MSYQATFIRSYVTTVVLSMVIVIVYILNCSTRAASLYEKADVSKGEMTILNIEKPLQHISSELPLIDVSSISRDNVSEAILAEDVWEVSGASRQCFTYMGWQLITNERSPQYQWRSELFPDWDKELGCASAFDEEGFGRVDGRYVVATTYIADGGIANVGQYLDMYLVDGTIIQCVVGEVKSPVDDNWSVYGHMVNGDYINIIEFCVYKQSWYGTGHSNPGRPGCHPEWSSDLDYIIIY